MYILSDHIKVFPAGKYRSIKSNDYTSRIFYEQNVSNLIRQLIDVPGFIISGDISTQGLISEDFSINLYGYNFIINSGINLISINSSNQVINKDNNPIGSNVTFYTYVGIKLQEFDNSIFELQGQDVYDNGELVYQGLEIFNDLNKLTNLEGYASILPILVGHTDGNGLLYTETSESPIDQEKLLKIYKDSYIKFNVSSLNIDRIDGKN